MNASRTAGEQRRVVQRGADGRRARAAAATSGIASAAARSSAGADSHHVTSGSVSCVPEVATDSGG